MTSKGSAASAQTPEKPHPTRRIVSSVPYPATNRLTIADIFDEHRQPRIDLIKDHFVREGRLDEAAALRIISDANSRLKSEKNLVDVPQPVVIVGDLHGQFYDMVKVFEIGGSPEHINYLFLGDYVDRGHFSIEIVLYLWSLKIVYPHKITLLRGNHECRHLADHFTFKRECLIKYSPRVYDACIKSFHHLPLCALVNKQLFCVHGGISPELITLNDVHKLNREREPPPSGLMCDLLWSDPAHEFHDEAKDAAAAAAAVSFTHNATRGCSYFYNFSAVAAFLKHNGLLCVIRAHEAQDSGFRMYKSVERTDFPSLITLFSAPNYLDIYNNKGAVIVYQKDTMHTKQYGASSHPYWLPNFMDVFTWSLPFVAEKVTELLIFISRLNVAGVPDRREVIHAKLVAISRVAKIYSRIRERNESLIELKGITPSNLTYLNRFVATGLNMGDGRAGCMDDVESEESTRMFDLLGGELKYKRRLSLDQIKELDKKNECFPGIDAKSDNVSSLKKS